VNAPSREHAPAQALDRPQWLKTVRRYWQTERRTQIEMPDAHDVLDARTARAERAAALDRDGPAAQAGREA
jgi:hypothetical protein